jgi:aconitase A
MDLTPVSDIHGARVMATLGDSVTTDHISPAGNIKAGTPPRSTSPSTASRRRTSTPTARAAATTRS